MTLFNEREDAFEKQFALDAKSIVLADFHEPGDADVIRKAHDDLDAAGQPIDETSLKSKLVQLMAQAVEEIKAGR
jgi:hypothetical protein